MALAQADESDRPIPTEAVTYPERAIRDACMRAVQWRQRCAMSAGCPQQAIDTMTYETNHTFNPDPQGWVSLGWLSDPVIGGSSASSGIRRAIACRSIVRPAVRRWSSGMRLQRNRQAPRTPCSSRFAIIA